MKYLLCIATYTACIYAVLKAIRWTGRIEIYEKGGVREPIWTKMDEEEKTDENISQ